MTTLCLIADLAIRLDIEFTIESGRLVATGNTAGLTDQERAWIGTHKSAIIAALAALPAGCRVSRLCLALGPCPDARARCSGQVRTERSTTT